MIDHVREYAEALYRSAGPDAQLGADIIDLCDSATLGDEYSYIFGGVTPEQTSETITRLEGVEAAFTAPFEDDVFWIDHYFPFLADCMRVTPEDNHRILKEAASVRQALIDGGALDEGDTDTDIAALVRYLLP